MALDLTPAQRLERDTRRAHGRKAKDHEGMSSDEYCSPPEIADPLFDFWGWTGCDPCSNERSIIKAKIILTSGGLVLPWGRSKYPRTAYANWPYSQNDPWAAKAIAELAAKRIAELVILCMTATSTLWWKSLMMQPRRNPRVICTKRLGFLGPDGKPVDSSRFEPALIYYGARAKAFDKHFGHVARWSTWGR